MLMLTQCFSNSLGVSSFLLLFSITLFWQVPHVWRTTSSCLHHLLIYCMPHISATWLLKPDWLLAYRALEEGRGFEGWQWAGLWMIHWVASVNGGFYGDQRSVMWPCTLIRVPSGDGHNSCSVKVVRVKETTYACCHLLISFLTILHMTLVYY